MNKYAWDLKQIRNYRDALVIAYDKMDDEYKQIISDMIEMYSDMLHLAKRSKDSFSVFNDKLLGLNTMDLISELSYSYSPENLEIINSLLQIFPIVNDNYIEFNEPVPKIISNNEYLVSITKDFFKKMTTDYINKQFLDEINSNHTFLNFTYAKKNDEYGGITLFDVFFNKKYINISRTNHLSDLSFLSHEMFHYLLVETKVGLSGSDSTYFIREIEGMFADILFGEYFKEYSNKYNFFFIKKYISLFQFQIEELAVRNQLLDSIKDNKKIRLNKLNKFMYYHNIDKFTDTDDINDYLEIPQEINMKYAFSYLAALDLYYIYLRDKEFAFYLLKNICLTYSDYDVMNLLRRNHITFMDDDYENYKKYTKKLVLEENKYGQV